VGVKLADDVWQVIKDYLMQYREIDAPESLRKWVEENVNITPFDGGAFISKGNEFDLFVVPDKRGKWRIRSEVIKFLTAMLKEHDKIVVGIYDDNQASLRLAKFFGFTEIGRENGMIRLELHHG
jgi:hypothetical protein